MQSELDNVSALRIELGREPPGQLVKAEWPKKFTRRAWVPQTMGDQVWCFFEFETKEERKAWEKGLSDKLRPFLDRDIIPYIRRFGWHIRDMNGFIIKTYANKS